MMARSLGNVLIFGDSYTTYTDWNPAGYDIYYPEHGVGFQSVEDTWWKRVLTTTDSVLVSNDSWSGSTVCKTGYYGEYCHESSFVVRAETVLKDGICQGQKVDTVLIFGGTNDSWADSPLGEPKYADWTEEDLKCFFPAFCKLLDTLCNKNPQMRVIALVNAGLKKEVTEGIPALCRHYGAESVSLQEVQKVANHPTPKGMEEIAEQLLQYLDQN